MRLKITRLKSRAQHTSNTLPRTSTMSEASVAISAPLPKLMPTSASARAGESFTPSPTITTTRPSPCSFFTCSTFAIGSASAITRSDGSSSCLAIDLAVRRLSPVTIHTSMPLLRRKAMDLQASSFSWSAMPSTAHTWPSTAARMAVLPVRSSSCMASSALPGTSMQRCCMKARLPADTVMLVVVVVALVLLVFLESSAALASLLASLLLLPTAPAMLIAPDAPRPVSAWKSVGCTKDGNASGCACDCDNECDVVSASDDNADVDTDAAADACSNTLSAYATTAVASGCSELRSNDPSSHSRYCSSLCPSPSMAGWTWSR
mmetsp:Transcript_18357/g.52453  ORF Transcript_18357/g.52453 Transcript_18357/m.52453 type:complete len:320 (+) Transcript_18357:1981-2940(+)